MKIAAKILVVVTAFGGASLLTREALKRIHKDPSIRTAAVSNPWIHQTLGSAGIEFDSPWPLKPIPLKLPPEVAERVAASTTLSNEGDGMNSLIRHTTFQPNVAVPLEQVADGTLNGLKSVAGTVSVAADKRATTVAGYSALELEAKIERQRGGPLEMRGLVFGEREELYQVEFFAGADQSPTQSAWQRLGSSIRRSAAQQGVGPDDRSPSAPARRSTP